MSPVPPRPDRKAAENGQATSPAESEVRLFLEHYGDLAALGTSLPAPPAALLARLDPSGLALLESEMQAIREANGAGAPSPPPKREHAKRPSVAIPGYEVRARLGRGGQGEVYLAFNRRLGREEAVKVLSPPAGGDLADWRARVEREAKALASIEHPGVVPIHGTGVTGDGRPYLAMKYLRGGSLAERITAEQGGSRLPQNPKAAARLIQKLAAIIDFCHGKGVVHRDVKPENVLFEGLAEALGEDDCPVLADFGLAKPLLPASGGLTRSSQILGTRPYMAPEQIMAERFGPVSRSTDIWALGVLLYELLTGARPFPGEDYGLLTQITGGEPIKIGWYRTNVKPDLEAVCMKCLRKHPRRRFSTAKELADDLERFLQDEPTVTRPSGLLARAARWGVRNRLVVGPALVVITGLGIAAHQSREAAGALARSVRMREASLGVMGDALEKIVADQRLSRRGLAELQAKLIDHALPELDRSLAMDATQGALAIRGGALNVHAEASDLLGQVETALQDAEEAERIFDRLSLDNRLPQGPIRYGLAVAKATRGKILGRSVADPVEAIGLIDQARGLLEALRNEGWDEAVDIPLRIALCWNNRGNCFQMDESKAGEALSAYGKAVEGFRGLATAGDDSARLWLVKSLSNRALYLHRLGRRDKAALDHGQAIGLARTYVQTAFEARSNPDLLKTGDWLEFDLDYREALGIALTNQGECLLDLGQVDAAAPIFRDTIAIYHALADAVPSYRENLWSEAMARSNLGEAIAKSNPDEALLLFTQAESWYGPASRNEPADMGLAEYRGKNLLRLANLQAAEGRPAAALAAAGKIIESYPGEAAAPWRAEALTRRASCLQDMGQPDQANAAWREAVALIGSLHQGNDPPNFVKALRGRVPEALRPAAWSQ